MFRTTLIRTTLAALSLALFSSLAAAQGTIKIAVLGPMAFPQGKNHWNGAEMARDEINKAGGSTSAARRCRWS
jgi:ABC-type branched-subunit amino acid transport system substrate-binding protein